MKKIKILTALTIFIALALPTYAAPPIKDVNIANTTDVNVINTDPIPVSGDVNVLTVPPITVDTPVRTPFQKTLATTSWDTNSVNLILDVPWGQRLVIEYISAFASMSPNEELSSFAISTIVNGISATHQFSIPETAPGFTGSHTYVGGQSVRLYADEGALIRFTKVGSITAIGSASITVSGYLIPFEGPTLAP